MSKKFNRRKSHKKNPLSESALTVGQIHVGQMVINRNVELGTDEELTILTEPYYKKVKGKLGKHISGWRVDVASEKFSEAEFEYMKQKNMTIGSSAVRRSASLRDMGIIPYKGGGWNRSHITVDKQNAAQLPPFTSEK